MKDKSLPISVEQIAEQTAHELFGVFRGADIEKLSIEETVELALPAITQALTTHASELQAHTESLKTELDTLEAVNRAAKGRIGMLEARVEEYKQKNQILGSLNTELEDDRIAYQALKKVNHEYYDWIQLQKQESAKLVAQIQKQHTQLEEANKRIKELQENWDSSVYLAEVRINELKDNCIEHARIQQDLCTEISTMKPVVDAAVEWENTEGCYCTQIDDAYSLCDNCAKAAGMLECSVKTYLKNTGEQK